jgi:hypothetical protein
MNLKMWHPLVEIKRSRSWLVASAVFLASCGGDLEPHPPLYPVQGKVTRAGKPVSAGTIIFEYDGTGPDAPKGVDGKAFRATAKVQDGAFRLIGYAGAEGMPAGSYKVGFLATKGRSEAGLFGRDIVIPQKSESAAAATRYADPKTSGLTAQVTKDGPNEPVFDLK